MYRPDGRLKHSQLGQDSRKVKLRYSKADVISFSGCKDTGTSMGIRVNGLAVGAMSHVSNRLFSHVVYGHGCFLENNQTDGGRSPGI
jgi:hypothetical protein